MHMLHNFIHFAFFFKTQKIINNLSLMEANISIKHISLRSGVEQVFKAKPSEHPWIEIDRNSGATL